MPTSTEILIFIGLVLLAIIAGHMAHADGATIRAGAIGFAGTLTLLLAIYTAYIVVWPELSIRPRRLHL
ncbi:hypothetical protein [Nocardia sp. NPDC050710]|uniref:hypothetical protein n=1 Tax=Nocardia sp. NPDC050710 TaxID=3157220 RepID=UPI0034075DAB